MILNINQFIKKIKDIARQEKSIFLRIEPAQAFLPDCAVRRGGKAGKPTYQVKKVNDVQPSKTIILDLKKSEEELLSAMHPKTRYNIRLAEKKGVTVREAGAAEFEIFWNLMQETTGRDGFRAHGKEYYRKMLEVSPHPAPPLIRGGNEREGYKVKLYFAEYKDEILAAGIFVFYGDTVTYLHGASTHEHKEIMAPYALHWQMIKLAKKLGYAKYDFYGIDEQKWPGVTRFKRGFGSSEVDYPGCYDVIFDKRWYVVYKLSRGLRRIF